MTSTNKKAIIDYIDDKWCFDNIYKIILIIIL